MRTYFVYILASRRQGTLYIGVTNDLLGRVALHREGLGSRFTSRHGVNSLVYFEPYSDIGRAIQREKSLKRYRRQWKINVIERENPHWMDLYPGLRALPENKALCSNPTTGPRNKPEHGKR